MRIPELPPVSCHPARRCAPKHHRWTPFRTLGIGLSVLLLGACTTQDASDAEAAGASASTQDASDTVRVEFQTVEEIEAFFEEVNYSPQHWADGVREIPRMYVTAVGERWQQRANDELTVEAKKRIFFRSMAPLALRSNELIQAERERLQGLAGSADLSEEERGWLGELAGDYGVEAPAGEDASDPAAWDAVREELQVRVDGVPVSLVLAQAANESGWGTSRFAGQGNALFGQWSFGGSGMLPEQQRESLGDYRVAAFESPLLSVIAYMRNLNTHRSYARLRELRAQARAAGDTPRGLDLAAGLESYSERGQEYVDEIRSMIEFNGLEDADVTYLAPGPVYLVLPAALEG
jgi:uncharacterized FlgJ-related protein